MESNDRAGVALPQPRDKAGRTLAAAECCNRLEIHMPVLVDDLDDRVGNAYSGMPDRLYVIDRDGKVAYKGGRGPFGYKPGEMEQALAMLLLDRAPGRSERPPMSGITRVAMPTKMKSSTPRYPQPPRFFRRLEAAGS